MDEFGDEDELQESIYANGHWLWSMEKNELVFISDVIEEKEDVSMPVSLVGGVSLFHDDMDIIEQSRYQRRMQRKSDGPGDVILLQDVKDLVLYTAPKPLLSSEIIRIFHLPVTERFLRALILYCQYYIQIAEIMAKRSAEEKIKIPTENSLRIEKQFRENLQDLRLLMFKEYAVFITGGGETSRFHHMGTEKKSKSLSKRDALLFETILVMCIQIVWISLGRQWYNQIEHEVHRLMKSEKFNTTEHHSSHKNELWITKMTPREHAVLRRDCLQCDGKLNTRSPLYNEFSCHRDIDYRIHGIGTVSYKTLDWRLSYLENVLTIPETKFKVLNITLGIIGLQRNNFDITLKPLPDVPTSSGNIGKFTRVLSKSSRQSTVSRVNISSRKHSRSSIAVGKGPTKLFPDLHLPEKQEKGTPLDESFPTESPRKVLICEVQREKWIMRYKLNARKRMMSSKCRSTIE